MTRRTDQIVEALTIAEDILSRSPHSTQIAANGMHPQIVIEKIRAALETAHLAAGEAREGAAGDIELVAQWFYEEMRPFDQGDWRWPEHENDDGYRGERARVCLAPSDVQAKCRDNAKRLLGYIRRLDTSPTPAATVPPVVLSEESREQDKRGMTPAALAAFNAYDAMSDQLEGSEPARAWRKSWEAAVAAALATVPPAGTVARAQLLDEMQDFLDLNGSHHSSVWGEGVAAAIRHFRAMSADATAIPQSTGLDAGVVAPGLSIKAGDDGTWLCFKASTGKSAMIHLESLGEGFITNTAIKNWCADFRALGGTANG